MASFSIKIKNNALLYLLITAFALYSFFSNGMHIVDAEEKFLEDFEAVYYEQAWYFEDNSEGLPEENNWIEQLESEIIKNECKYSHLEFQMKLTSVNSSLEALMAWATHINRARVRYENLKYPLTKTLFKEQVTHFCYKNLVTLVRNACSNSVLPVVDQSFLYLLQKELASFEENLKFFCNADEYLIVWTIKDILFKKGHADLISFCSKERMPMPNAGTNI
jgi:hypothetical protein